MSRLWRRALVGVVFAVVVYVAALAWVETDQLKHALRGYPWSMVLGAVGLSSVNYLLRFWKWELCVSWLEVRKQATALTRRRSLIIYLAGLSMSVTPGKIGEVLRSVLLRASDGVAFSRTAPIVVADRLTDLVALVILASLGATRHPEYLPVVGATMVLVVAGVTVVGSPRLLGRILSRMGTIRGLSGLAERAEMLAESSATVLSWRRVTLLSVVSVAGWGLECVGYWLILNGFSGVEASLDLCTFLWATTTLVGALSFLPGGLGATEGSLAVLVTSLVGGVTTATAVASTLLIRGATLWYGELVGAGALAIFLRDPRFRERAQAAERELGSP